MMLLAVAPWGRDDATGASASPLATLAGARDRLRQMRGDGTLQAGVPVRVEMRGGDYYLPEGLALGPEDGGTAAAPVVYGAAPGEEVRLLGGRLLSQTLFHNVRDTKIRRRLSPAARDMVLCADLRAAGFDSLARLSRRGFGLHASASHNELFFNGAPMTLAQWPRPGKFTCISGFCQSVVSEWGGEVGDLNSGFTFEGERPAAWKPSADIWAYGYWSYDWASTYQRVVALDAAAKTVRLDGGVYYFNKGQRFYFLNILEEITAPGDYYIDHDSGLLYFWPPAPLEGARIIVSQCGAPLLDLRHVSHLLIEGLTLEGGRGSGIAITGGRDVAVADCHIRNFGNRGVVINYGFGHAVKRCEINGVGDDGISLRGGCRATLTGSGHEVSDCHIHHFARWSRCYTPGINAYGVGMAFLHNLIHDAPHSAIIFWGNEFRVCGNEIYRVCLETGDAGAIYTGRNYAYRGNVVSRNFLHHMGGVGMGSFAIYNDDCVSGTVMEENVLWRCQTAIHLGGGRDYLVKNNFFVECDLAVVSDARGIDSHAVWHNMVTSTMADRLLAMRPREEPYRSRYPAIAAVLPYLAAGNGVPPANNVLANNLCVACREWYRFTWPQGAASGITELDNAVLPQSLGQEMMRDDLPALQARLADGTKGFNPIDFAVFGPRRSA